MHRNFGNNITKVGSLIHHSLSLIKNANLRTKSTFFFSILGIASLLIASSFAVGALMMASGRSPAVWITKLYYRLRVPTHPLYTKIAYTDTLTKPEEIIGIHSESDVEALRDTLIRLLWGKTDLLSLLPDTLLPEWKDVRWNNTQVLRKIDKIIVRMDYNLESHVYHFFARNPNGKVILYHVGHMMDFNENPTRDKIIKILERGYDVIAFCMPLYGLNNTPMVRIRKAGYIKLLNHNLMRFLEPEQGCPIKYFIEPVISILNYLEKNYSYSRIAMMGISGGGWTTTLSAAIDDRITYSFPVASTMPLHISANQPTTREGLDYEQMEPVIYTRVSYPDLYIMGSHGEGRMQIQIINKYDIECFYGIGILTYGPEVKKIVEKLGNGKYDFFLDDSHYEHDISEKALKIILDSIK